MDGHGHIVTIQVCLTNTADNSVEGSNSAISSARSHHSTKYSVFIIHKSSEPSPLPWRPTQQRYSRRFRRVDDVNVNNDDVKRAAEKPASASQIGGFRHKKRKTHRRLLQTVLRSHKESASRNHPTAQISNRNRLTTQKPSSRTACTCLSPLSSTRTSQASTHTVLLSSNDYCWLSHISLR